MSTQESFPKSFVVFDLPIPEFKELAFVYRQFDPSEGISTSSKRSIPGQSHTLIPPAGRRSVRIEMNKPLSQLSFRDRFSQLLRTTPNTERIEQ